MAKPQWQSIRDRKLATVASCTPSEWLLTTSSLPSSERRDITSIPATCGLLSSREITITSNRTARSLLTALQTREYTAIEVTVAFCKVLALFLYGSDYGIDMITTASSDIPSVDKLHHRTSLHLRPCSRTFP